MDNIDSISGEENIDSQISALDREINRCQTKLQDVRNSAKAAAADELSSLKPAEDRDTYKAARNEYEENSKVLAKPKEKFFFSASTYAIIAFDILFCIFHILTAVFECYFVKNPVDQIWFFIVAIFVGIAITVTECILAHDAWTSSSSEELYVLCALVGYLCYLAQIGCLIASSILFGNLTSVIDGNVNSYTYQSVMEDFPGYQNTLIIVICVGVALAFIITLWRTIYHFRDNMRSIYFTDRRKRKKAKADIARLAPDIEKADALDKAWHDYDLAVAKARDDASNRADGTDEARDLQRELERLKAEKRELVKKQKQQIEFERAKELMLKRAQKMALESAGFECEEINEYDDELLIIGMKNDVAELVIPDGIPARIDDKAFEDCNNIVNVTIGDGIAAIGERAFAGCRRLERVTIGDGVTEIDNGAFLNCQSLKTLTIGYGIKYIGKGALPCSSGICSLRYNEFGNGYYIGNKTDPYVVFIRAKNKAVTACEIHPDTKIIYQDAFYDYAKLSSVEIPTGVRHIGESAFKGCVKLKTVTVPYGARIEDGAFKGCAGLKIKKSARRAGDAELSIGDTIAEDDHYGYMEMFLDKYVFPVLRPEDAPEYYNKQYGENAYETTVKSMGSLDNLYGSGQLDDKWLETYSSSLFAGIKKVVDKIKNGAELSDEDLSNYAHFVLAMEKRSSVLGKRLTEKLKNEYN